MEWELAIREIIGPDSVAINWWQMVIRGIFILLFSLMLARLGDNRIFGKSTTFDIALSIILGSLLSRAITGNAPFFPTLITTAALVMLHMVLAKLAVYTHLGKYMKGQEKQLIKDGQLQKEVMRSQLITEHDILEAVRQKGRTQQLKEVDAAFLERDGSISIIPKNNSLNYTNSNCR
jgi:uncharacterized membrane protein YcaP (DUF421 family)